MTSPTCLTEYQNLVRIMPKLLSRVTCPSCDKLLLARDDFTAGYHEGACMGVEAQREDQSLYEIYSALDVSCPNQSCSQVTKVSCLLEHLIVCESNCNQCGLRKDDNHDCVAALKASLVFCSWEHLI